MFNLIYYASGKYALTWRVKGGYRLSACFVGNVGDTPFRVVLMLSNIDYYNVLG